MLEHFLLATVYTALVVMFLSSAMLFAFRKSGDRSRLILCCIIFISVFNYIPKLISIMNGTVSTPIMSVPMLSLALFMIISYTIYPIEVISPGWVNFKRLLLLYSPVGVIFVFYWLTLALGITYPGYSSIAQLIPHYKNFDAGFRIFLCMILCLPIFLVFYIPYTRKYSNTDRTWIRVYVISGIVDVLSYLLVLACHTMITSILYFHFTIALTVLRLYMELIYRIVDKKVSSEAIMTPNMEEINAIGKAIADGQNTKINGDNKLYIRLQRYMMDNQAWRNPNMSLRMLTEELGTNRTTLSKAVHQNGIDSISLYINKLRISDFVSLMKNESKMSIKEAFFICGYRSRTTALRNFRQITGTIPSDYFGRNIGDCDD
jgi:AraC-like DNA-binding protein